MYGFTLPAKYEPVVPMHDTKWIESWIGVRQLLDDMRFKRKPAKSLRKELESLDTVPYIRPLLRRIINKDLRCGVGPALVEQVFPGLLGSFCCQLATDKLPRSLEYPVLVEPKFDGVRVLAFIENAGVLPKVTLWSRSGRQYTNFPSVVEALEKCVTARGIVLDGEVIGDNFQELMTEARRTKAKKDSPQSSVTYHVFDWVYADKFKRGQIDPRLLLNERLDKLTNLVKANSVVKLVKGKVAYNYQDIDAIYDHYVKAGYEGVIVKQNALYGFGRSNRWIKLKPTSTLDLPIMGFVEGTGKHINKLGAIEVIVKSKRVSVGTGFSDDQREAIWKNRNSLIGKHAEVKYQEMTQDGSLRFPVFMKFRPDKD